MEIVNYQGVTFNLNDRTCMSYTYTDTQTIHQD